MKPKNKSYSYIGIESKYQIEKSCSNAGANWRIIAGYKCQFKLENLFVFTSGKDSLPFVEWLAKMKEKINVDNSFIDISRHHIAYVMSCVCSITFSHLDPCVWKNKSGPKPWNNSNKMLAYLEKVFRDLNRCQNAKYKFQILRQKGQDFNTF